MKPVIIIPAFSRAYSLQRLLNSIENAKYPDIDIQLIISLDGGASEDVVQTAKTFTFTHGNMEVIERKENLGLREHILWCGDQTEKYGSVIVLEDDLFVDPQFYLYAKAAYKYYKNENRIAGIALHSPSRNEYFGMPFWPVYNGTTGFFMQVGCSSGQLWFKSQWKEFKEWYKINSSAEHLEKIIELPPNARNWPESSWKKYYSAYLTSSNKCMFYPYATYTTNCGDDGGHHLKQQNDSAQVRLSYLNRRCDQFTFPDFSPEEVSYDSYMEPTSGYLNKLTDANLQECTIDLYGMKPIELLQYKKYALTSRQSKSPIKKYPLRYKPIEINLLFENEESNRGYIVLSKTDTLDIKSRDDVKIRLIEYFIEFSLHQRFIQKHLIRFYTKKKGSKIYYWFYRKVRFIYRLFK